MRRLSQLLCKYFLPRALGRACEARIPRSGAEGAAVNCFVTSVQREGEPYKLGVELAGDSIVCLEWDGTSHSIERTIPLAEMNLSQIQVTHYYGLWTIEFDGILDFVIARLFPWVYAKAHITRWVDQVDQYFFNKKKLITKQRTDLLKFMIGRALDGHAEFSPLTLMTHLHSIKWFLHPQGSDAHRQLRFYLDALVDTGELRRVNGDYALTGQALRAVEESEEQERKHTENVKMQRRTFWLTVVIALLTVVQAKLVELPTLLSLR